MVYYQLSLFIKPFSIQFDSKTSLLQFIINTVINLNEEFITKDFHTHDHKLTV